MSYNEMWSARSLLRSIADELVLRKKKNTEKFTALMDINLCVGEHEILGIIGPNGGGKSTLLRTISGIYTADSGRVTTRGRISTLLALGTGFDNALSGRENIWIGGLIKGLTEAEIQEKEALIISYAELGDFIDVPMKFYSNGMISRIGFSIVLATDPDILLIDEVMAVGDLAFKQKSEKTMEELLRKAKCQLIVTHSLEFVEEHCTRAIYINGGRIVADSAPEEVVRQYKLDMKAT